MRPVDSQVLGQVAKSLGLSGTGAARTEFEDGILQQSIDVGNLVRRGGVLAGGQDGIWQAALSNVHVGAGDVEAEKDFYNLGAGTVFAGFPGNVGKEFDLWMVNASVECSTTLIESAGVFLTDLVAIQGGAADQMLCAWDSRFSNLGGNGIWAVTGSGGLTNQILRPVRIPRGASVKLASTFTGAGTAFLRFSVGMFPAGMGQDVVG